jgi:hypothetical protein
MPRPHGPRRRPVLLPERDWLLARLAAAPDLTVRALRAEFAQRAADGAAAKALAESKTNF